MSSQSSNTQSFGQDFLPTPFPTVPSWDCPESEESQARARGTGTLCSSQAAVTLRPFFLHHLFFFFFLKTRIFSCITTVQVNRFRELTIDAGLVSNIQSTFRFYQSSYKVIRIQIQDRVSLLPSNLEEFLSFGCCCCFVCFFIWLVVVVFVIHALRFFEKCRDPP